MPVWLGAGHDPATGHRPLAGPPAGPHWSDPSAVPTCVCARLPISGNPRTASAVGPCAPPAAGVLIADVRGTPDAAAGERRAHDERPTAPAVRRVRPGVR